MTRWGTLCSRKDNAGKANIVEDTPSLGRKNQKTIKTTYGERSVGRPDTHRDRHTRGLNKRANPARKAQELNKQTAGKGEPALRGTWAGSAG